ncbi:AfsR/SARP family transcriptional regulator [Nocardia inohanensis]|uniref:AfsR/SARP family transcriptional regulator n=1 Tax=Nocardia inohanensis TaxID=209246 RepID=UPI00082F0939|nr:tetratricopeptide repeat protein [Nocardia inohanensis]
MDVRFSILGPVEVRIGDQVATLAPRHRGVLAYLLLNADRVCTIDRLIEAVWGLDEPDTARAQIHASLTAIRRVLRAGDAVQTIQTRAAGYVAYPASARFDLTDFTDHVAAAERAADPRDAIAELRAGLAVWRGDALGDLTAAYVAAARARLHEQRLTALERLMELELSLGRHRQLLDELIAQVAENPLRERLTGQLVLALYRAGRQRDALASARALRTALVEQHGLDPGPAFIELEQAVLRGDPELLFPAEPIHPELHRAPPPHSAQQPEQAQLPDHALRPDHAQLPDHALRPDHARLPDHALRPDHAQLLDNALRPEHVQRLDHALRPEHAQRLDHARRLDPVQRLEPAQPIGTSQPPQWSQATAAASLEVSPAGANFLPYDIPDFAGRTAELDRLGVPDEAGPGGIVAIDGMAGVGKTALAVHAAHRLAERYPDGRLFVDLQAYTAERVAVPPAAALEILLRQLGIPADRIPVGEADRSALWRSELARRRIVVVLDNAADADHVRPLLPAITESLILITSRRRMIDLDGVHAVSMPVLPPRDAVALFERIVGARAIAEPVAALDVLQLCGFLPLAVRIAAARLLHRPQWSVGYLAGRLRNERRRLVELTTAERGVAAAFSLSYGQLAPAQQRLFRLLGLHPGRDIDPVAAAALADLPHADDAEVLLEELLDVHVVAQHEPGRYLLHDLLRAHATAIVAADESDIARQAALSRLFDHYLHTARAAVDLLFPHSATDRRTLPPATSPVTGVDDPDDAVQWLHAERANLLAVIGYAADHERPEFVRDAAATLRPYLDGYFHHTDAARLHAIALVAGRRLGDRSGEARALADLGWTHWRRGEYADATRYSEHALSVARANGDRFEEARALNTLGNVRWRQHDPDAAREYFRGALSIAREIGNRSGEAHVLGNLALVLGDDRHDQAREYLERALDLHRQVGNARGEALVLNKLGTLYRWCGRTDRAREHHGEALELYRSLGTRGDEAAAWNGLGHTARADGDAAQAISEHATALDLAEQTGNLPEAADAHEGLARAYQLCGQPDRAREHAELALKQYRALGLPVAGGMPEFLATLS